MDAVCSRICRFKLADPILPCHVDSMNDFETFVRASSVRIAHSVRAPSSKRGNGKGEGSSPG